MKKIRIGYLGSGPISHFHIPAIKKAGFEIVSLFTREKSNNVKKISSKFGLINPSSSFDEFISLSKKKKVQAYVVAIKTEHTPFILKKLSFTRKYILSEKPGAINSKELKKISLNKNKIYFAYNRRFYKSINFAKSFVKKNKPCNVNVRIPDSICTWHQFIINGCHVIDILRFIFGKIYLIKSYFKPGVNKNKNGFHFILKSKSGDFININLNWGFPDNFNINIFANKKRIEINPLEVANLYEKMEIIPPSTIFPLRTYVAKKKKVVSLRKNFNFKPGFLEQYIDFKNLIINKKYKTNLCNFKEALENLILIEKIKKNQK
jgi:predicted dehydrogenase